MTGFTLSDAQGQTLPRGVHLRRGELEDELTTFDVMRRAMGQEMTWAHHAATRHHLRESPDCSFWVAEETPRFGRTRAIGYARSVVREKVWSLTEFFLLPEVQRRGIGGSLLERCLADGDLAGADTRLALASHHPGADSLYIRRAGCTPRLPMLLLCGPTDLMCVPEPQANAVLEWGVALPNRADAPLLRAEPALLTPQTQAELDALDRQIVGYARPLEHAHWVAQMGGAQGASRFFRRIREDGSDGELIGYAYQGLFSSGPALALDPAEAPRLIAHTARLSLREKPTGMEQFFWRRPEQYCALAGTNEVVLRWLLSCGWQIAFHYLFMSSRPIGQFDRYTGHNPIYLL